MSTESFHRHTRRRVDAATRHVFTSLAHRPAVRGAFAGLRVLASERSDLLRALPPRLGAYPPLEALRNLAGFHRDFTGEPATWPGATGHPLRIIDSLARHLLGCDPGPRFLASVWFGAGSPRARVRREWFIAHARGQPLRSLPSPVVMTRRMRHAFLCTPDHLSVDHGFRRAEVIGLGGDELDLAQVWPIIEYAHAARLSLRGRSYASVVQAAAMSWSTAHSCATRGAPCATAS